MATQEEIDARNAQLDQLKEAVDEWHEAETARLEDERDFLKSFLRGRTGSERLSRRNAAEAEALVNDDITSFLSGS